jgi:IS5 family transposase
MRKRNWRQYNKHLVQQGSISFFIDPKVFKDMGKPTKSKKKRGRPIQFSDALIEMLFVLKIRFRLPYRALEGFAKSLFENREFLIPTYSLICKRISSLELKLPRLDVSRSLVVILDASGLKVYGEGEWKVKIHGPGRPRKWVKLHIAIDAETQEIVAECTTESTVSDSKVAKRLLDAVPGKIRSVLADGAYDKKCARDAVKKVGAKELIPPPKNARYRGTDSDRDQAIAAIRGLGGDIEARSIWGKLSGYSKRSLVETAFSRDKRLFGERLFSKSLHKQSVENTARCILLNRMRMK